MDAQNTKRFDWKICSLLALSLFLISGIDSTEQKELAELKSQGQRRAFASTPDESLRPPQQASPALKVQAKPASSINLEDPNTPVFITR